MVELPLDQARYDALTSPGFFLVQNRLYHFSPLFSTIRTKVLFILDKKLPSGFPKGTLISRKHASDSDSCLIQNYLC
jgi:hypothetical protein